MKAKGFGAWPIRNDPGSSTKRVVDEYNRMFKRERPQQPKEYTRMGTDEYSKIPETKDFTQSSDEQEQRDSAKKDNSQQAKQRAQSQMRQNLVGRFVAVSAGTVVLVNTNPVLANMFPFLKVESLFPGLVATSQVELVPEWTWSEDNLTVTLTLKDDQGETVKELPVTVDVEEEPATCTAEGLKTFTASATEDGKDYTDSRTEPIPPTGHAFGEGNTSVSADGQTTITFECTNCHETFTIVTHMAENDT